MFRLINKLKNRKGFTLIELIVVLAVLAVIAAIAIPRFIGVQEKAREDSDMATLMSIAKLAEVYYVSGTTSEGAVEALLPNDFPSGVDFQSTKAGASSNLSDVDITFDSDGVATVKVGTLTYTN